MDDKKKIYKDDMSGNSIAAMTLKKKKRDVVRGVVKNAIKKLKGGDIFDPNPVIDEKDTVIKA